MSTRISRIFLLGVVVALVTAACAAGSSANVDRTANEDQTAEKANLPSASSGANRVLEVDLSEFSIEAASFEFVPGETVEFLITNSGVVEHEFRLSNQDRIDEHLEGGHDDHDEGSMTDEDMASMDDEATEGEHAEDDDHAEEAEDAVLLLAGGESGTLVFTFPDNDHDYAAAVCLIPGHYEAGMATDISYSS